MLKIKTYEMTCSACPSQWDIWTENDEYIYVRYRGGHFYARIGCETFYSEEVGGFFSGVMGNEEMMIRLAGVLDFSEAKEI